MNDVHDRSRCYHCGASGVPLVEWQPDPPRPDVPGPFPVICALGCGVPAPPMRITLSGSQTLTGGLAYDASSATVVIENRGSEPVTIEHERPRVRWQGPRPVPELRHTVPWDPELGEAGGEVSGRTLRAVLMAARIASERGWSAEALRRLPRYHNGTLEAACCRVAIRWGLIR
jgi:hypothetical protein